MSATVGDDPAPAGDPWRFTAGGRAPRRRVISRCITPKTPVKLRRVTPLALP
jgi:hypothetical protein